MAHPDYCTRCGRAVEDLARHDYWCEPGVFYPKGEQIGEQIVVSSDGLQWWLMPMVMGFAFGWGIYRLVIIVHILVSLKFGLPIL